VVLIPVAEVRRSLFQKLARFSRWWPSGWWASPGHWTSPGWRPTPGRVVELTHLSGRPIRNATVEIWQCDANQVYLHTADSESKKDQRDKNFQGFGRFITGSTGEYYFRTIKPVPYPGRPAPHIHFKVKKGGRELLTSQINIAGHPGNEIDGIVRGGISVFDRELLMTEFTPIPGSKIGELAAQFAIILGRTPDEELLQAHRLPNR
jgi:protocatechuate 3,4-dioxygenase beta subunit